MHKIPLTNASIENMVRNEGWKGVTSRREAPTAPGRSTNGRLDRACSHDEMTGYPVGSPGDR